MDGWATLIVPVLTALGAGALAAVLTRRSTKESNVTNAFNVVVTQLLSVNDSLRKDIDQAKRDIVDLGTKYSAAALQVNALAEQLEDVKDINRTLAKQLGLLVQAWPPDTAMPPISDDWRKYVN